MHFIKINDSRKCPGFLGKRRDDFYVNIIKVTEKLYRKKRDMCQMANSDLFLCVCVSHSIQYKVATYGGYMWCLFVSLYYILSV